MSLRFVPRQRIVPAWLSRSAAERSGSAAGNRQADDVDFRTGLTGRFPIGCIRLLVRVSVDFFNVQRQGTIPLNCLAKPDGLARRLNPLTNHSLVGFGSSATEYDSGQHTTRHWPLSATAEINASPFFLVCPMGRLGRTSVYRTRCNSSDVSKVRSRQMPV